VAEGKDVVAIESGGAAITSEIVDEVVWIGLDASLTVTVIGKLPFAVGVPEMRPVLAARLSPVGRLPEVIDQTYGEVPPVAAKDFE
jgi:hypothetical protein